MRYVNEKADRYVKDLHLSEQTDTPVVSPLTASLAVNYWCNSKCDYCWIWKQPVRNVDLEDLKLAARQLKEIGIGFVSLSGGEPFLHPHLAEFVGYLHELEICCSIMTNGMLLRPEKLKSVLEGKPNAICLSLDTLDPVTYQKLRGVRLEPILEGFEYLLSLRDEYPDLTVFINCVVSRANLHQMEYLVEYCNTRNVPVGFQPLHPMFGAPEDPTEHLRFQLDEKEMIAQVMERLIETRTVTGIFSSQSEYMRGFPDFLTSHQLPMDFQCSAGFTTVTIDSRLNIKSCWPMSPIGQIKEDNLVDLWKSEKYAKRRKEMLALKCPKCWLRCHLENCSPEWLGMFFTYTSK